jgi:hypothetical protein
LNLEIIEIQFIAEPYVSILLVFHRDGVLFVDEDVFSDGLGIEVGLRDGYTGELLSGRETDIVVQKKGTGWWLEKYGRF